MWPLMLVNTVIYYNNYIYNIQGMWCTHTMIQISVICKLPESTTSTTLDYYIGSMA